MFGATGFVFLLLMITPAVSWWTSALARPWTGSGGLLIVLGSSMIDESVMGYSSYIRAVYAAREWQTGKYQRILISGGPTGPAQKPVAEAIAEFLVGNGVPRNAIQLETQSRNTHENAESCARLLQNLSGENVLLTSDFHSYRASRAFAHAGVGTYCHPIADAAKRYSSSWLLRPVVALDLAEETGKIAYYWWKGWI